MPTDTPAITRQTVIQEVLDSHPDYRFFLVDAFGRVGLRCVGCGAATHETIEQGGRVHGFSEEMIDTLVKDLNAIASGRGADMPGELLLEVKQDAADQLRSIMEAQNMVGAKLRLCIKPDPEGRATYGMKLVDEPQEGDIEHLSNGIPMYVCRLSAPHINGTLIVFDSGPDGSGFRFEKPEA